MRENMEGEHRMLLLPHGTEPGRNNLLWILDCGKLDHSVCIWNSVM